MAGPGAQTDEEEAVALAREVLLQEQQLEATRIELVDATAATWPDSSLGCPVRGMTYLPVITSGYRVTLEAAGGSYAVHVAGRRAVVCRTPAPPAPSGEGGVRLRLIELTRTALAEAEDLSQNEIVTASLTPRTWPDDSLGCPEPGRAYAPDERRGYVIELRTRERTFLYHTDQERVVLCEERPDP